MEQDPPYLYLSLSVASPSLSEHNTKKQITWRNERFFWFNFRSEGNSGSELREFWTLLHRLTGFSAITYSMLPWPGSERRLVSMPTFAAHSMTYRLDRETPSRLAGHGIGRENEGLAFESSNRLLPCLFYVKMSQNAVHVTNLAFVNCQRSENNQLSCTEATEIFRRYLKPVLSRGQRTLDGSSSYPGKSQATTARFSRGYWDLKADGSWLFVTEAGVRGGCSKIPREPSVPS